MIQRDFGCQSLLFYSGPHLEEHIDKNLPRCTLQQVKNALLKIRNKTVYPDCPHWDKCKKVKYEVASKDTFEDSNGTFIVFRYETFEIENHKNYVSFGFVSMLGEIGGILGLTLGLSGVSITIMLRNLMCPPNH